MEVPKNHLRHVMLYEFKKGNSAAETARNIHSVYGEECVNERTCRRWFAKFRGGDFTLKDEDRIGHVLLNLMIRFLKQPLKKILVYQLRNWPESLVQTIQLFIVIFNSLEKFLNLENGCLMNCLKTISNPELKSALLSILDNLFHLFWIDLWLATKNGSLIKMLSVVDSGLVKGTDPSHSREENFMGKKLLLSIWWDRQGIIHFELLPPNATINAQLYFQQLERLNQALRKKRTCFSESKRGDVSSRQCTTPHNKNHFTKGRRTWLGENSSSTLFSRPCSFRLSFVS